MSEIKVPRISLRERQREQTHEHLLRVAAVLFGNQGYEDTTIDDIAQEAITSRATIYSYFKSKDAILRIIIQHLWESGGELYSSFGELEEWTPDSIRNWIESVIGRWETEIDFLRVSGARFQQHDEEYLRYRNSYIDQLTTNATLWSRFSRDQARATALYLIGGLEIFLSTWIVRGWDVSASVAIESLTEIWCRSLMVDTK